MKIHLLTVATLTSTALFAQDVTATVTALTPLRCTASDGGTPVVTTRPAGVQNPTGSVLATEFGPSASAFAMNMWTSQHNAYESTFLMTHQINLSGANSYGDTGPQDLLVEFGSSGQPIPVRYTIEYDVLLPSPAAVRSMELDVNNDGVFEWTPLSPASFSGVGIVGQQPLALRLRSMMSCTTTPNADPNTARLSVRITVTPDNGIDVQEVASGCTPAWNPVTFPGSFQAQVPFYPATGADLQLNLPGSSNSVLPVIVIGFSSAPLPLTPLGLPSGCLAIPSPDIALNQSLVQVPLPPAVRPVSFWAQSFSISTNPLTVGVASGRAFRIFAY